MNEARPIVCTLTDSERKDRGPAWQRILAGGQVERVRIQGGIELRPQPGVADALLELIDLERECCAWIDYEVGAGSVVKLTAEGDGEALLAEMFVAV
ncbi:MAG: hypothetical protein ACREOM_07120 [Candidatus Dormibacteraceae bacterium]